MPIDLAKPRVLALTVGKRKYTHTVKPITKAMWLKYFGSITNAQELVNGDLVSDFDSSGARLELLEASLIDATGYTPEGVELKAKPNWQTLLPMNHRRAAADLLVDCAVVPDAELGPDEFPELGRETVTLRATWSANAAGTMHQVSGLQHIFNSPAADHQKRYSRALSRSIVVGGSRTGKTLWLGAQDTLMEIYDELISEVHGYVSDGESLTSLDDVRAAMDGYHKVAAATALFTPVEVAAAA